MKQEKKLFFCITTMVVLAMGTSCRTALPPENRTNNPGVAPSPSTQEPRSPASQADDAELIAAQNNQERKVEVTVQAPVYKKLADDTRGLPHERFLLRLKNGSTVLVAHDTKEAPYVPLQPGDLVRIHGEYIWNSKGGLIHWTHRAHGGRHEDGWIELQGHRYQ